MRMRIRRRELIVCLAATAVLVGTAGGIVWSRARTAALLQEGDEALSARDYPRAKELLDRYLAHRPKDLRARLLRARVARKLHDYSEAREHLRLCREGGGEVEPTVVEESLIELQNGDEEPVAFLRERVKKSDELSLVILEELIQHDIDTYQLRAALDGYTRYLALRPSDLQALLGRGYIWERLHSPPDALADYRAAVAAHPNNPAARLKLGETELRSGSPREARTQFLWLTERYPDRVPAQLGLARCIRRLGDPAAAKTLLDAILAKSPEHGETLWERGELELETGEAAAAEPFLQRAAKRLPYDRGVHYALYRCLLKLNRAQEAEAANARVAQLNADLHRLDLVAQEVLKDPNNSRLRCEGGLLFLRNGEKREAIRWLQMALRLDPTNEAARTALAGLR